jgi:hypothetical protein
MGNKIPILLAYMKKRIKEGISSDGNPDLKYYAFDWDDNIVTMPTQIIVKNDKDEEVGMSTEDFAKYRSKIGKEDFNYKGSVITSYADTPFRNFKTQGDKLFIIDSMLAKPGPAWKDFKESINNGSIFSIITARGHNPNTIKEAVYNYIISGFNGLDKNELLKNLKKYREFTDEDNLNDMEMIKSYLDLCKFYPVSFGAGAEANPEEAKVQALEEFVSYVKDLSSQLHKKAYLKNNIRNFFLPTVGFSDDDIKNVEAIKKHFKDKEDNIVKTYSTSGGIKKEY